MAKKAKAEAKRARRIKQKQEPDVSESPDIPGDEEHATGDESETPDQTI